jgi:hypothetical protein
MDDTGKRAGVLIQKTIKRRPASGKGNPEAGLRLGAFLEGWVWRDMNARQTHFLRPLPGGIYWGFQDGPTQVDIMITTINPPCQFGKNTYFL